MRKKLSPLQRQVLAKGQALRLAKGALGLLSNLRYTLQHSSDPLSTKMILANNEALHQLEEVILLITECHYTSFKGDLNA